MGRLVSIGEAAQIKGVSIDTLRYWEKEGKLSSVRTEGGHRRYRLSDLIPLSTDDKKTIAYCRVSSHDQKTDLERQALVLSAYCESHNWNCEIIKDLGSGLNYKKKGLRKLIDSILNNECDSEARRRSADRIVISHKDRLLRFGSELICQFMRTFRNRGYYSQSKRRF
jgi:putative resolvase